MRFRQTLPLLLAACSLLLFIAAPAQAGTKGGQIVVRALAAGGPHPLGVSGARVSVLSHGHVVGRGRTGSRGVAFLRARSARGPLLIRVGDGRIGDRPFKGRMEALLPHYRWPQTAHVDSITTLAARFVGRHRVDYRRAVRRVRRFLRLPAGFRVGVDGRTRFAFDGRRFLRAAKAGGYDALVARLVRRMARPGTHRSFRPRSGHRHRGSRHRGRFAGIASDRQLLISHGAQGVAEIGEAISNGTGFFEDLEKTDYVLDFADAVIDITGVGGNSVTAEELREVSSQLQQVEEGVATVRAEIGELRKELASSTYGIKAEKATEYHEAIAVAEDSLQTSLQAAAQGGCTEHPVTDKTECERAEDLLKSVVDEYGAEGPATAAKMRTYADYIAGYAEPEGSGLGEGLLQAASHLTTDAQNQVLYTPDDSQLLTSFAAYWVSSYAQGLVLAPLYARLEGEAPAVLEEEAQQLAPYAKALVKATPHQLAAGTVIDMSNGTMWSTEAAATGTAGSWSLYATDAPWRYVSNYWEGSIWKSGSGGARTSAIGNPPEADIPGEDWQVAGLGQINQMLEAVHRKPEQTPGEAVLEQAGFNENIIIGGYGGYGGEGLKEPVPPGRGVEMEYQHVGTLYEVEEGLHINSGCYREKSSCYWPVWVGNGTVGNFNEVSPTHGYVEGSFEAPWYDLGWSNSALWGYDNKGTIYGNDPIANIPYLLYRSIDSGECYYYPGSQQMAPGSPGCPTG